MPGSKSPAEFLTHHVDQKRGEQLMPGNKTPDTFLTHHVGQQEEEENS